MKLEFKWIGGATWVLMVDDKIKIACDPVLCPKGTVQDYRYFKSTRLNAPVYEPVDFRNVNLWLLTHDHEDHFDAASAAVIDDKATVVAHPRLQRYFTQKPGRDIRYLDWKQEVSFTFGAITVKVLALPAIHAKRRLFAKQIGNGNGYRLDISGQESSCRIYVTGDSVFSGRVKRDFQGAPLDLVIANAGRAMIGRGLLSRLIGRVTNDNRDIGKLAAALEPKRLIPVHWGTFSHYSQNPTEDSFPGQMNITCIRPGNSITILEAD